MAACLAAGRNPQQCMPTYNLSDVTVSAAAYPTQSCDLTNDQRTSLKEKVANDMSQKMSNTSD